MENSALGVKNIPQMTYCTRVNHVAQHHISTEKPTHLIIYIVDTGR